MNMTELKLKRVLGLPAVVFCAVGMTIGGGVFVFTGIVFRISGRALPLAYAMAVLPVLAAMMPLAMLGASIPTTGGNYRYPSRMVSPGLAFVGIWVYALASFFGQIPLYAIACAKYAQYIFPSISITLFAIVLVTVFLAINLLGVKLTVQIQGIMVVVLISALLYYAFAGITTIQPGSFSNMLEKGSANLLLGTALLTFTYLGANSIIEMGGEIINPGKTIPRAFLIAFPLIAFVYIAVAIATVGHSQLELLTAAEPLIRVCQTTCSKSGLLFFIIGGAVIALTTTLNALFLFGTRSLLIIVKDGILPKQLGRIHPRFGTLHILLISIWLLSIIGIMSGLSLETLASYAALGGLIIFFPIMIAAARFPSLYPDRYAKSPFRLVGIWLWLCVSVGMVMVLFFGIVLMVELKSPLKVGWFLLFILSGIIYYQFRKRYLSKNGIDLIKQIREKETWDDQ
jgi:basic amino acid/polyamine antiporter, APA family